MPEFLKNINKGKLTSYLFFGLGLGILGYLLYSFGFDRLWANILKTGWWFVPVIGVWLFVYMMNALVMYLIVNNGEQKIPYFPTLTIGISGFAINYITPFLNLGGEPYKIYAFRDYMETNKAVSTVILYTMMHWLSHFFIWLTAILLFSLTYSMSDYIRTVLLTAVVVILLFVFWLYRRYKKGIFVGFHKFLKKVPLLKKLGKKLDGKEERLQKIDEQITELYTKRQKVFYQVLFTEYAARVISSLEYYFILLAIDIDITLFEAFYIYAGSTLITNILFFMPLQLGSREGSLVLVFEILGLQSGFGIFTSLITRIREFFWILVGLLLIQYNKSRKEHTGKMSDFIKGDYGQRNSV